MTRKQLMEKAGTIFGYATAIFFIIGIKIQDFFYRRKKSHRE